MTGRSGLTVCERSVAVPEATAQIAFGWREGASQQFQHDQFERVLLLARETAVVANTLGDLFELLRGVGFAHGLLYGRAQQDGGVG